MKKLLSIGLLAMCAFALSEHPAQAWVNSRFSIGLNWHHQSANTSYLWGLWRNGQVPGPEAFGAGPGMGGPGMGGPGMGAPLPQSQPFPFFGANGQGGAQQGAYHPNTQPGGPQAYPIAAPQGFPGAGQSGAQQTYYNPYYGWTGGSPYQTVNYQPSAYQPSMYYPSSAYYHPYYNPGQSYEAPFYWYSNNQR